MLGDCAFYPSCDRVQVRLHEARHPANAREAGQFGRAAPVTAAEVAKGFDRHVNTDLVAVLEAVGDRLCGGVHADFHALAAMRLDAFGEGGSRETGDSVPRVVETRLARFLRKGDPHLGWGTSRQVVEKQRGGK